VAANLSDVFNKLNVIIILFTYVNPALWFVSVGLVVGRFSSGLHLNIF
jgi:sorbitol-specific phosphotransferase system component IIC